MARWLLALIVAAVACIVTQDAGAAEERTVPKDHPERVKKGLALFPGKCASDSDRPLPRLSRRKVHEGRL